MRTITCGTKSAYQLCVHHVWHKKRLSTVCTSRVAQKAPITCDTKKRLSLVCTSHVAQKAPITCGTKSAYQLCVHHVWHKKRLSRVAQKAPITCGTKSSYHVWHKKRLSTVCTSRVAQKAPITCGTKSAYHVHVVWHVVRRASSSIESDRVEIAFILALIYGLKLVVVAFTCFWYFCKSKLFHCFVGSQIVTKTS